MNPTATFVRDPAVVAPVTPVYLLNGSIAVNLNPGDIQIGSVSILDDSSGNEAQVLLANAAKGTANKVLLVQNVDTEGSVLLRSDITNIDSGVTEMITHLAAIQDTGSKALAAESQTGLATADNQTNGNSILTVIMNGQGTLATSANQTTANSILAAIQDSGSKMIAAINNPSTSTSTGTVTLVDQHGRPYESLEQAGDTYLGVGVIQDVHASTFNSSSTPIIANGSFVGLEESTLGVAGIQVVLNTDQDCSVVVEQSGAGDGVWDVADTYNYEYAGKGQSWTTQAVGSTYRVRVTSTSGTNAAFTRINTALCPIVEALPRALSASGNLRTAVNELAPTFGVGARSAPGGKLMVADVIRQVGAGFGDSTSIDPNFWTTSVTGSGSVTTPGNGAILSTGATTGSTAAIQSARTARYVAGQSLVYRAPVILAAPVGENTRKWGAFSDTDGFHFECNNGRFRICIRKGGVSTYVDNGNFNGDHGASYFPRTSIVTYEIYWLNKSVWFLTDDIILHRITATTTSLANTLSLPVRAECNNGTNTNNNSLTVLASTISRVGSQTTQPILKIVSGAGVQVLKRGPGNLLRVNTNVAGAAGSRLVIYDNTVANARLNGIDVGMGTYDIGLSAGGGATSNFPNGWEFLSTPFSNGLCVTTTGAGNTGFIYE